MYFFQLAYFFLQGMKQTKYKIAKVLVCKTFIFPKMVHIIVGNIFVCLNDFMKNVFQIYFEEDNEKKNMDILRLLL